MCDVIRPVKRYDSIWSDSARDCREAMEFDRRVTSDRDV
jgi:hypothetical protein